MSTADVFRPKSSSRSLQTDPSSKAGVEVLEPNFSTRISQTDVLKPISQAEFIKLNCQAEVLKQVEVFNKTLAHTTTERYVPDISNTFA